MARPRSAPDFHLLGKVSTLYYLRDQTQHQIAERLGLSRPAVSRLLTEARRRGIVQIAVAPQPGAHLELESRLEERFGLDEAQIVTAEPRQSPELLRRQLGAAAAAYLARTVQSRRAIGLTWGTTLSAMVQAMPRIHLRDVEIVQMLGGIGPPSAEAYAADVVRRLAQALDATAVLLPAPGVVATTAVRDVLRKDTHVRDALQRLDALDVAFVGIGALSTNALLADGRSVPARTLSELRAGGAVGDVALRFFDAAGEPVRTSLDDRLLGITRAQLQQIPHVVAVAGGAAKADAIHAALLSGTVDVLITDHLTAERVLQRADLPNTSGRSRRSS